MFLYGGNFLSHRSSVLCMFIFLCNAQFCNIYLGFKDGFGYLVGLFEFFELPGLILNTKITTNKQKKVGSIYTMGT